MVIADDLSWCHTGAYGGAAARTPNMDRLAREGVLFRNAFCDSPSCTPSRGAILTGRHIWQLGAAANLWSHWPGTDAVYPDLLAGAGYAVGLAGKGWAPGSFKRSGRTHNPAGPATGFEPLLARLRPDQPFCFWFGSSNPHRTYAPGSGIRAGFDPAAVEVPPFLPDTPEVRSDLCDYLAEVEDYDREIGVLLNQLDRSGRASNTLVVVTSDNGFPFPRGKANLYDHGLRMPLIVRWPGRCAPGTVVETPVTLSSLAPTFLEAAGVPVPAAMSARSLIPLLAGGGTGDGRVYAGRERHADVRAGELGYPSRAVRTTRHLYIRNFAPDRWPAGDPPLYGDCDQKTNIEGSPSKAAVLAAKNAGDARYYELAMARRPAEELYDLTVDPCAMTNLAARADLRTLREELAADLEARLRETGDPRVLGGGEVFDTFENSR
jgi:N-sulfoglucosamine sulfohydrolase